MKTTVRTALFWSVAWIAVLWFLIPALASWHWDRYSLIRFDPLVSKDYDCIFVEGHSTRSFTVPWLSRSTPLQYLRIRYTPNDGQQPYGIMFVDPQTLAYEAHDGCAAVPSRLGGRLDSARPVLNWMRSQPHSALSASHTNDAQEILAAIRSLAPRDLEHFTLPRDFTLQNFVIGHQSLARRDGPNLVTILAVLLFWVPCISKMSRKLQPEANAR